MVVGLIINLILPCQAPDSPLDVSFPGKQSSSPGEAVPGL